MPFDWHALPSPFYRVTLKAIVLDEHDRLLVVQTPDDLWEMPGGGWDFDEDMEMCLRREFREELGRDTINIGAVSFMYRGVNERGFHVLRIAVQVDLQAKDFTHGPDMQAAKFVTKDELTALPMGVDEAPIAENSH